MLSSIATGCALPPGPPTAIAAAATTSNVTAVAAGLLHGLPGLQLPLFGDYLCGRNVCSNGRYVQFDPEPGE